MSGCNINSEENFISMYEAYYSKIYNYVFFRILNKEITEDLVSDIFLKIFSSRERYDPRKSQLSTWIFTIAKNCVTDYYRKKKDILTWDFFGLEEVACTWDLENSVNYEMDKQEAVKCLCSLGEKERMVVYLRYFMEFSYREIAGHLDISEKNVSVILVRSIKKIRTLMEKSGNKGAEAGNAASK